MSAEHNHAARCCCEADTHPEGSNERISCPGCPEHGVFAPAGAIQMSPACRDSVDGWCVACSTVWGPVYHPKDPPPATPYTEQETTNG